MADSNIAQDQLQSFVRRIESVEDEINALNSDKSEIYKEARSNGFDTKILRKVIAKRKLGADEREEQDTVFDLYWDAVHGAKPSLVRAHEENIEEFDADVVVSDTIDRDGNRLRVTVDPRIAEILNRNAKTQSQPLNQAGQTVAAANSVSKSPAESDTVEISAPVSMQEPHDEAQGQGGVDEHSDVEGSQASLPSDPVENKSAAPTVIAGEIIQAGKSVEASASAAPAPMYAEPGVVTWESTPPEGVRRHEYSLAFGDLGQDIVVIADDIAGAKAEPIVKIGNEILDGWARYMTARGAIGLDGQSTEYPVVQYDGTDPLMDCIRWNVAGRILNDMQKRTVAQRLARLEPRRKADIYAEFELGMELA